MFICGSGPKQLDSATVSGGQEAASADAALDGAIPEGASLPSHLTARFDQVSGRLTIIGDGGDNTIRQSVTPDGFLQLFLDGRQISSSLNSAFYDAALAGATRDTLQGIAMIGGDGDDCLILGDQSLGSSLSVTCDDALTVEGTVQLADSFEATASAIDVTGSISAPGGRIHLQSSSNTFVQGTLDVSNTAAGGRGGNVEVLGDFVGLFDSAAIDASGQAGGGVVLFGGDYQGHNPGIMNARHAFISDKHRFAQTRFSRGMAAG